MLSCRGVCVSGFLLANAALIGKAEFMPFTRKQGYEQYAGITVWFVGAANSTPLGAYPEFPFIIR
jgi:hypothetical protein